MAEDAPVMPFGHNKGVPLSQIPKLDLEKTREWCRDKEENEGANFALLINAIDEALEERMGPPLEFGED